jgi:adenylate kinase family enzyme
MIIGQPGAGKSTLARAVGEILHLPVFHIDHIHWQAGWVERTQAEKLELIEEVHAQERWVFEGGLSSTYEARLERADMLIWLDLPVLQRLWRVGKRSILHSGRTRPDLPAGCPERLDPEFLRFIWRTRNTSRAKAAALFAKAPENKKLFQLRSQSAINGFLHGLRYAVRHGTL